MNHNDYLEAGARIFPLHGVTNGQCDCGDPECANQYKHPRMSNWQLGVEWDDSQVMAMEVAGWLAQGFGVICAGLIVIDVDPRNGGAESIKRLAADLGHDPVTGAGFTVRTGGGGWHCYYTAPEGVALAGHHEKYPGIDFKSSGFVVGCGSLHKSGARYEAHHGHPCDIVAAPQSLIDLLRRPDRVRFVTGGVSSDLDADDLRGMVDAIPNADCDYDQWIAVGMGLHDATGGGDDGYQLWLAWSSRSSKHNPATMDRKWHSFGKCANPVTAGTLFKLATDAGWRPALPGGPMALPWDSQQDACPDSAVLSMLKRPDGPDWPPGFAGELCRYIDAHQCRMTRTELVKGMVLAALGNVAGLRWRDRDFGATLNSIAIMVAGSSTGKESVQQAAIEIYRAAGIAPAVHGGIKSEQEMIRNLLANQMAVHQVDEAGYFFGKLKNAARSGASYLEGVIAKLMEIYTKADSYALISGDVRTALKEQLNKDLSASLNKVDANEDPSGYHARNIEYIKRRLETIDSGIERPFLSLQGYTTPTTFDHALDFEQATNGLMARAMIWREQDDVPQKKKRFIRQSLPPHMLQRITEIAQGGYSPAFQDGRVEWLTKQQAEMATTAEAADLLDQIDDYAMELARKHTEESGFQSVALRLLERVLKLSGALAVADGGTRTAEHVAWAFRHAAGMITPMIRLAQANQTAEAKTGNARQEHVAAYIMSQLAGGHGLTVRQMHVKRRSISQSEFTATLQALEASAMVVRVTERHAGNGTEIVKWVCNC